MFSRLRVRTKILAILIPPALALAAFAGIAAGDRLDDRSRAETAVTVSNFSDAIRTFSFSVQAERLGSVSALASGETTLTPELTERHSSSDAAAERLTSAAAALESASDLDLDTNTIVTGVTAATSQLQSVRELALTEGSDVQEVFDGYSAVNDQVIQINGRVAARSEVPGRATQALHWGEAAVEAEARAGAAATIGLYDESRVDWANNTFAAQAAIARNNFATYAVDGSEIGRSTFEQVLESVGVRESNGWFDSGSDVALSTMPAAAEWTSLMETRFAAYAGAEAGLLEADRAFAADQASSADRGAKLFILVALLVLGAALGLAILAARAIITNLSALTDAARNISSEQLPDLVRALESSDHASSLRFTPVDLNSNDEFAEVAAALNGLGATALDVAEKQRLTLRRGISDIFVNLARRNQSLLDRQIEFIDVLEANEQDPDQLESLFRLDHLATRMRRNAESLLVLAGAEPPRRRLQEVTMNDVIRVAVGEVEDYSRIELQEVEEATTNSGAAVDIAHLLSELMENGSTYSPPETAVRVSGETANGGYLITVTDDGVGMTAEQIDAANDLMSNPPAVGLAMSRSLGFTVVSTLAARHHLAVRFMSEPNNGVTVRVAVPANLLGGLEARSVVPALESGTTTPAGRTSLRPQDFAKPLPSDLTSEAHVAEPDTLSADTPWAPLPTSTTDEEADLAAIADLADDTEHSDAVDDVEDRSPFDDLPVRERAEERDQEPLGWNPLLDPESSDVSEAGDADVSVSVDDAPVDWDAQPEWSDPVVAATEEREDEATTFVTAPWDFDDSPASTTRASEGAREADDEAPFEHVAFEPVPFEAGAAEPFAPAAAAAPSIDDDTYEPFESPAAEAFAAPAADTYEPFAPAAAETSSIDDDTLEPFESPAAEAFAAPAADTFEPFESPAAETFTAPAADTFEPFESPAAEAFAAPAADTFEPFAPAAAETSSIDDDTLEPFESPAAETFAAPAADTYEPFAPAAAETSSIDDERTETVDEVSAAETDPAHDAWLITDVESFEDAPSFEAHRTADPPPFGKTIGIGTSSLYSSAAHAFAGDAEDTSPTDETGDVEDDVLDVVTDEDATGTVSDAETFDDIPAVEDDDAVAATTEPEVVLDEAISTEPAATEPAADSRSAGDERQPTPSFLIENSPSNDAPFALDETQAFEPVGDADEAPSFAEAWPDAPLDTFESQWSEFARFHGVTAFDEVPESVHVDSLDGAEGLEGSDLTTDDEPDSAQPSHDVFEADASGSEQAEFEAELPPTLADSLSQGDDIEEDLATLLAQEADDEWDPSEEDPADTGPAEQSPLPVRTPGAHAANFAPPEVAGRVASPVRPPEQVRQNLANYRAGRRSGRTDPLASPTDSLDEERP